MKSGGRLMRRHCRGVTLTEALVASAIFGVGVLGVSTTIFRNQLSQRALEASRDADMDRVTLHKKLSLELNQSKVARYLNLPVNGGSCDEKLPSMQVMEGGRLRCAEAKGDLGMQAMNFSFFSDTVSGSDGHALVAPMKLADIDPAHGPDYDLYGQRPRELTLAQMDQINALKNAGRVPYLTWPLIDEHSKPFILIKQIDLGGATLHLRYEEDFDLQPPLSGEYKDFVVLSGTSQNISIEAVRNKLVLAASEANPEHYFVKALERLLNCAQGSADFDSCREIVCANRSGAAQASCTQKLGSTAQATHYVAKFTSVSGSLPLVTNYLPQDYNRDRAPHFWFGQDPGFYIFPTDVPSLMKQAHGAEPGAYLRLLTGVPQGDMLKQIVQKSIDVPDLRTNWVLIPVDLMRYSLVKEKAQPGAPVRHSLVSEVFINDPVPSRAFVVLRKNSRRIVFAREMGSANLLVFEDYGVDDARSVGKIASAVVSDRYLSPMSQLVASYPAPPVTAGSSGVAPPGLNAQGGPAAAAGGCPPGDISCHPCAQNPALCDGSTAGAAAMAGEAVRGPAGLGVGGAAGGMPPAGAGSAAAFGSGGGPGAMPPPGAMGH